MVENCGKRLKERKPKTTNILFPFSRYPLPTLNVGGEWDFILWWTDMFLGKRWKKSITDFHNDKRKLFGGNLWILIDDGLTSMIRQRFQDDIDIDKKNVRSLSFVGLFSQYFHVQIFWPYGPKIQLMMIRMMSSKCSIFLLNKIKIIHKRKWAKIGQKKLRARWSLLWMWTLCFERKLNWPLLS